MLDRLHELANQRADFAFESTLSGRTYMPFLQTLKRNGYAIEIYYFWLEVPELAVERVHNRVLSGGHHIPEATIRRRFQRSILGFWRDYRLWANAWYVYDNSGRTPRLLALGNATNEPLVDDKATWSRFLKIW